MQFNFTQLTFSSRDKNCQYDKETSGFFSKAVLWQEQVYPITEQLVLDFFPFSEGRHHVRAGTPPSITNHHAYMAALLPTAVSCPALCHPSSSMVALTEPHFSEQREPKSPALWSLELLSVLCTTDEVIPDTCNILTLQL